MMRGDLECLCCPTRNKATHCPGGKCAGWRGVCHACRGWLARQVAYGKMTEDEQVKAGLILPKVKSQWGYVALTRR